VEILQTAGALHAVGAHNSILASAADAISKTSLGKQAKKAACRLSGEPRLEPCVEIFEAISKPTCTQPHIARAGRVAPVPAQGWLGEPEIPCGLPLADRGDGRPSGGMAAVRTIGVHGQRLRQRPEL
jgi:hypothetical protein